MSGIRKPGAGGDDPRSGGAPGTRVAVFRVVDAVELGFLQATGQYGSNLNRSGKYFALTLDGARAFANATMNVGCRITATTLPLSIMQAGVHFHDPGLNGAGPSVFFAELQLESVYASMADPWILPEEHQVMTRNDFCTLFVRALNLAADQAERRLGTRIPRSFVIELHAPGCSGRRVGIEEAVDRLWLDGDRFYRIIDTAIRQVLPEGSVAFVRVSGHPPAAFESTWDPSALGPFKPILAEHVEDQRVHSG